MEKLRTTYVIGLVAAAVLILCGQIYLQFRINANAEDVKVINLAGRQRTLAENIAKNALLAEIASTVEEFNLAKRELDSKLKLLLLHHKALQIGDAQVLENPPKSAELTKGFAELQPQLDAIRDATENILKAEYGANEEAIKVYVENILKNQPEYYTKMNNLVSVYEKYFQSKQSSISIIVFIIGLVVFALILTILFAVLLPAISRTSQLNEDLEKAQRKLKNADEQLQNSLAEQAKLNEQMVLHTKSVEEQTARLNVLEDETRRLTADLEVANQKAIVAQRELQKNLIEQNRASQKLVDLQKELTRRADELEKSEKELKGSTQKLQSFLDALPIGVFILDNEGKPSFANNTAKEMLGKGILPEAGTEGLAEVYSAYLEGSEELYPALQMPVVQALQGTSTSVDNMEILKDGKRIPLEVTGKPIFDEQGKLQYAVAVFQDISERKRIVREMEKSEKEMRVLAEAQLEANEQLFLAQRKERERQVQLEKFNNILTTLAKTSLEQYGSLEKAFQTITEKTAEGLGIERVSIWDYTGYSIISKDLYQRTEKQHSSGLELLATDFPFYFKGIAEGEVIDAPEAHTHPNTFEFLEVYFKPLDICSLLDVPIRVGGELSGVVCCENTEKVKYWTEDEISFVRSISDIVALIIEADKRRASEENIKKLVEQFQDLFESSRDALLLLDEKGFFKCNDAAVKVYGCVSREDLLGKTPIDFSPANQVNGQGSGEAAMGKIQQAMQEGSALFEWTHTRKDGSVFPAEVLLSRVNFEGRSVLQATVRDITQRKQAEEELKKAFEKMRKSEEDMRALAEAQLEANEKLMLAEKSLKETLELEQKQKAELDRLVGQLKETQTQLVHNEKMASLGQLTAGIAHEINNPINFVYNGIDTLKISLDDLMEIVNKYNELDQSNGNKEVIIEEVKKLKEELDYEELTKDIAHLVSDIKKGAVRTMEIVKGLRVFSRLDEEERKMASIKDCLESTLILLNNKMKGRIELKTYYDETMPEILCYPGQLNQVFMNIINNAIQAIPEERKDGVISVYTENMQENVVIRIKDNGTGMSEQVKRRIFEPFFTTKQVGVGTGLGLSITFGIIEKHGGNIFVNSEEGRGTEFVIQLPKMLN